MKVGILCLQGAIEPHKEKLSSLGAEVQEVRLSSHLSDIDGIILPGGESTAMIKLLHKNSLWEDLSRFVHEKPSWGICAGSILLAKTVKHPAQDSFGAIDIAVERNAFGRQVDSFISELAPTPHWKGDKGVPGFFIRAPRIREIGESVQVLMHWHEEPVMVQSGKTLASTFHPELTDSSVVHEYFLTLCK